MNAFAGTLFEMYAGGAVPTSERDLERDARIILDEALNDRECKRWRTCGHIRVWEE